MPEGIWGDQSPRVSPDGKYVAFIRGQPAEGDIFVKNLEDDEVQRITRLNTFIDGFSWGGVSVPTDHNQRCPASRPRNRREKSSKRCGQSNKGI